MKKILFGLLIGFLIGVVSLVAFRFTSYKDPVKHTHFHANFSIIIDGKKVDFNQLQFMEEISACYTSDTVFPKQRAHLHDGIADLIHVHADGVTWEHFFINLGYNFGTDYLVKNNGEILNQKSLKFILNGKEIKDITNTLIKSEDKLLVSYGTEDVTELSKQYESIPSNAAEYNSKKDPAGCAGEEELNLFDKLKKSIF